MEDSGLFDEQDPFLFGEEDPDEGNLGMMEQSVEAIAEYFRNLMRQFTVPHVELVVVIGILLLIYQMVRIRSFGDIKLQKGRYRGRNGC